METIWCNPQKHFGKNENVTFFKESKESAIGKIFLIAVDKDGNMVACMRLKRWK